MIKLLKFCTIPVSDQDRALAFYTEKLGFKVSADQRFDESQRWIELQIGNSATGVVLFTPPQHADRIGTHTGMSFKCDDLEKTYAAMVERGVEFLGPPRRESWGASAQFKDPDGNLFVMSE
jgi:predicted enzyme related to lactoylglutathione lyase